jgi:hypothetical protein
MRRLPKGVHANSLPDLAHYRGHGIDRITANHWSQFSGTFVYRP